MINVITRTKYRKYKVMICSPKYLFIHKLLIYLPTNLLSTVTIHFSLSLKKLTNSHHNYCIETCHIQTSNITIADTF